MADGAAHAADLTVPALVDDESQDPWRQDADLGGRRQSILELDALAQRAQRPGSGRPSGDLGHVLLGHAV
jgi:hypothetical protein